jgi:hypothetical protein
MDAFTIGLAAKIAVLLAYVTAMSNGYSIPISLLLLRRLERRETTTCTALRLAGIPSGATLVRLVLALLRRPPSLTLALLAFAAWSCYALRCAEYGLFRFDITSNGVLLFALARLPDIVVALHRTVATLRCGIIVLAAHAVC